MEIIALRSALATIPQHVRHSIRVAMTSPSRRPTATHLKMLFSFLFFAITVARVPKIKLTAGAINRSTFRIGSANFGETGSYIQGLALSHPAHRYHLIHLCFRRPQEEAVSSWPWLIDRTLFRFHVKD
jgi:hypothetical protein